MSENPKPGSLKKDAAYVYGGYFLRYLSVLILVPYYGRVLGPEHYGKVLAAMSLMNIVWMVVNYGFSMTGARELASTKSELAYSNIFGRQLAARIILTPVGITIGVIGTMLSPSLAADPWFGVIATALGLVNAFNLGWFYQGLRKFRLSIAFEGMTYPINVILVLLLVRSEQDGLNALIGLLISASVAMIAAYAVALKELKPHRVTYNGGLKEIKTASTIFIETVNSRFMTTGSTYLLSILSTSAEVGYFGSVERLVAFGMAFLAPAAQILMPTITHRAKHAPGGAEDLIRTGILLELAYGACACLGGLILAPYFVPLLFGTQFNESIPLMRILVCAMPFAAFTHAFGLYVLVPKRQEKWLVMAVMLGNMLNLALVAVFARTHGGMGVALARVSGEALTVLALVFIAFKLKHIRKRAHQH